MKERPILFKGEMIRAILAGTKTQTRRIAKPEEFGASAWAQLPADLGCAWSRDARPRSPRYGESGDRLWCKETFGYCDRGGLIYRADDIEALAKERQWVSWPTWKPSIFMPRQLSRITLEVVEVRVQRVTEIGEEDARAEGVLPFFERFPSVGSDQRICTGELARDFPYRASYACLWDEINGDRALWSSNPWVWAVTFRRLP